jgi:surface protein
MNNLLRKETISLNVKNNTNLPQQVMMLGGTQDPLGIAPHILYQWDLTNEAYYGSITVTIVISSTSNPTPVSYTVPVNGYNINAVLVALNSLGLGIFQVSGNIIYVSNDFYIYGALTLLSTAFVSVWNTNNTTGGSSGANQIQLPLNSGGNYNFTVFWGDGTSDVITSWNQPETLHTYASAGTYSVGIVGTITEWSFGNAVVTDSEKLLSISSWGSLQFGTIADLSFYQCFNLDLSAVSDVPDLSASFNFDNAFDDCASLTSINRSNEWDTSNINTMIATFANCISFNSDISSWDVSNVTNMNTMFYFCTNFTCDISGWDTSQNTSMFQMFLNAILFNQPIGSWDVSSVTTLEAVFRNADAFNQPLDSWNVSNVTTTLFTFFGATAFNQPLNSWDVSSVTDMTGMFADTAFFNQNLNSWNTSNVTSMSGMFASASVFNGNISSWNVSNVTNMLQMFTSAPSFNGNISAWDVSSVTNMRDMFNSATVFNQNISGWSVGSVTDMRAMFNLATAFNQNIGAWNVSSVTTMQSMFNNATAFNQNIGAWDISNVSNFVDFMRNKTFTNYSSANLDSIYNNWSLLTVQQNVSINFGTIKYTLAGQAGKNILAGAPSNWIIADGGI